ncbi:MAG: transpeptidase family protein [Bacteroidales bacterium]|nr:transpeptidase family protein [Bacteroidales bacterium]
MSIKTEILWRVALVYLAFALFAIFIAGKIVYLQYIDDDQWKEKAENTRIQNFHIPPHRGDIYSADMRLLASSVPYYEVRMDLKTPALTDKVFYTYIDSLSCCLSGLFRDRNACEYEKVLKNARKLGNRYYLVKSKVNYLQLKELQSFPIFRLGRYKGGLIINQQSVRQKPHRNLAARTIGYTTKSKSGNKVGIEGAFEEYLGGIEGVKRMQKLSGNVWMPINEAGEIEPKDGSSVVTTIDVDLQDVAENALLKQLIKNKAHSGTAVLMEVQTGEIKAIVNLTDTFGSFREYYNYAVGQSSEPGSTFKLPVLLAAIEDGRIELDDTIHTGNGIFNYYDLTIRDDNYLSGGHGILTVEQVFELSSNVGMAKIITNSYKNQPQRFIDRLYGMGLNQPLHVEIKGEGDPVIRYPGDNLWSGVTLASMSYGYEVRQTPLQILAFYNAIANDGKMVRPRFVKEIRNHGKAERVFVTEVIHPSICSRSSLKKVKKMLEGVVEKGTATNLKSPNFKIAGKTGTAQIYSRKTGYKEKSYQASFVGYFPAEEPRYSCIVVIYSPKNYVYHGAYVAGPVFLEIANKVYASDLDIHKPVNDKEKKTFEVPYSKNGHQRELTIVLKNLHIKQDGDNTSEWVTTEKKENCIELKSKNMVDNLVPNVVSMGLKDAVYLLENLGLEVDARGRGSVRSQSLAPGTRVKRGDKIILEMSFIDS